ncbi:hypothetical protein Acr_27g0001030 [Actinidia rufa]|uniref:Subtilisin-like protease fibronectin type-III domain-containing protein n=1 Tax=Actinidia rufa TaxID=165716 RepID=A0A7J0H6J6_9ERIC|nr:hypothetical protein Acr_27g0001030 [Actinidia rufa]
MLDRSSVMVTPFSYGVGHIRAARASDPGLVYDLIPTDYLDFLCAIGYNHAHIREPQGVSVLVEPKTLRFDKIGEEKNFKLTIKAKRNGLPKGYVFGELHWSDGHHQVRSPIVVGSSVAK